MTKNGPMGPKKTIRKSRQKHVPLGIHSKRKKGLSRIGGRNQGGPQARGSMNTTRKKRDFFSSRYKKAEARGLEGQTRMKRKASRTELG